MSRLVANASAGAVFPETPTLHFYPEIHECPTCGSRLNVQKTRTKTVVTMDIGAFRAKEVVLFCSHDQTPFTSEQLHNLVPEGGTFGFDVIVEVGLALFVHCRNNQETMKALAAKNVFVSEREISYLGRKFIIYLALAHRESQPRLRDLMARRGGYILHVDGTCEGDSPNLFCGLDGISELVLDTIKIPSEKKELLIPFFQRIKAQYGEPKALVHDMGRGIITAVEEVFPGVADFICHFHFLRDIGKDLLLDEYTALQKRLRKLKVRSSPPCVRIVVTSNWQQRIGKSEDLQVVVLTGDGSAYGMGLSATSSAMDRNLDFIYLCYDNEGYGNTGQQYSDATPHAAKTSTSTDPADIPVTKRISFRSGPRTSRPMSRLSSVRNRWTWHARSRRRATSRGLA